MTDERRDIDSEPRESALSDMNDPDNQLAHITHVLQLAVSGQDRGQTPQLLPILLQHLSGSSQQRHVPLATGLQLLQLGAQALNLSAGNLQAQQAGCQVLRAVSQATIGLQELESDQLQACTHHVQHQSLEAVATTMLAAQGDRVLQNHGTAAMLALVGCDTRPIGPGVYDVNSTDREGCTVLHRLAKLGLSICLSALIHSCGTQLDFRHKCNGGQTPQMAAEAGQNQVCADILSQAASFGTDTAPAAGQPSRTDTAQAASLILDPRSMFPPQHAQPGHRSEDHQQLLPGNMPGLLPLLANMQGQTNAMLHLNMQPAHMYGYNPLPPVLSAPAPFRAGLPTDAASIAASQRASMESASTSHTRPSLDDASMLSRLYPSSSLESSFSLNRMSIDDPQHRMSSGSRRSSSWSPYHPLNTHTSPWPSRLASVFSEDPSTASERLSREFEGRMSLEDSRASMDAQSTVSTTACMPHHVTETIAEEEQEEVVESQGGQGEEARWAAAATPATVSVGGEEGSEAGQNWNWAWLAGQLPPEHGTNDPSTLLDDESEGASKHLWLGNLNTRLPRAVLKAVFEQHGPVDDVVTFPGRMYAFVNFQHAEDAARAQEALDGKEVASLSGGRRLTVRFRPSKRALGKLTEGHPDARDSPAVPQIRDFDVQHSESGLLQGSRAGEWEGSNTPSNRVWLGNISATATLRSVRSVFSKFGPLTDAAVFPARIGPLGYAFVNFEKVSDAAGAYQALNNVVLPALTGCKQLKMRFKPAKANSAELLRGNSESLEADWEGSLLEASQPSRHLLLGNTSSRPNESALETVFGKFGPLDSVKVFPGKTYALVSFKEVAPAAEAMQCLDGHSLLSVSGQKPLVIRYQSGTATQPSGSATAEGGDASAAVLQSRGSLGAANPSEPAKAPTSRTARSLAAAGDEEESEDDLLMPAVNLSNRLNPNNVHFDRQLAAQYKRMSKHEKEALWAADRARQHQLRELTELSQMAGLSATELSQLTELTQVRLGRVQSRRRANFPANNGLAVGSASGSALTGAASGLQAAAQSLLRQRMEALRQQGVGLRGAFAPPSPAPQWEREGQQHQQLQFQQQMTPMGFPSCSQPAGHWPPPQAGFMRGAAPTVPQHMMQRNHNQPPIGPSAVRAPGNLPQGYAAFHHNQQPAGPGPIPVLRARARS
ncbi:MAG: flowering time control FPA-like [Trebouxia sp. A1-2]|nr:MAG: flowering time control FPA-like [Trebouxia sp. A1-2]